MKTGKYGKITLAKKEEEFIRENWQGMTNKQLADAMGLRVTWLRMKLYEMGLKRMELEYWTDEQVQFLLEHYKIMGDVEIAEVFNQMYHKEKGWSKKHVEKKRRYLNLKRTEAQKKAIHKRNVKQGRFSESHWKRWAGRVTPLGETRVWRYENGKPLVVIRVEEGFVHYAPWLWKVAFGPVPDGHVVSFIDGNPLNVVEDNLTLLSREELMRNNSASKNMSDGWLAFTITGRGRKQNPELFDAIKENKQLLEVKRQQLLLNRELNKSE